jgi:threonine/homoserine efflux transporter RhtA
MTAKLKMWSLLAIGIAITIFSAMLPMIFESVVFRPRSGWTFLPWYFCDIVATAGGIATFVFVYIRVMKK